jgi:ESX-1-secreted protein regulator
MPQQDASSPSAPEPPADLPGKINRLFAVHRPPHEPWREYRNKEVVTACRAAGMPISESHLSELRRGVKPNPTLRTLETIAWFFSVRPGYFTDPDTAAQVEVELTVREVRLKAKLEADHDARKELADAASELQEAIRQSGVTKTAHRATARRRGDRETVAMMRALARIIRDDDEDSGDTES